MMFNTFSILIKAGIPDEALSLALEPEVASLYCKENLKGVKIPPGTRYIIADLGGMYIADLKECFIKISYIIS